MSQEKQEQQEEPKKNFGPNIFFGPKIIFGPNIFSIFLTWNFLLKLFWTLDFFTLFVTFIFELVMECKESSK